MAKTKLKLEKGSLMLLVLMGILPLVISALGKFDIVNLATQMSSFLTIIGSGFILNEQVRKHGKKLFKNTGSIILVSLVSLGLISAFLSLMGIIIAQLQVFEGILLVVIVIGILVELMN